MMNSFKNNFAKILSVDLETFNNLCSMIYKNNLTPSISSFERVNLQFCVKKRFPVQMASYFLSSPKKYYILQNALKKL